MVTPAAVTSVCRAVVVGRCGGGAAAVEVEPAGRFAPPAPGSARQAAPCTPPVRGSHSATHAPVIILVSEVGRMVLVKGCPQCGGVVEGYPAQGLSCTRCGYRL